MAAILKTNAGAKGNAAEETVHATSLAIHGRAVLLMGPSGIGKSDLALRLIDRGATLVSDDYTCVQRVGSQLRLHAPERIAGKIEVRNIGIMDVAHVDDAPAALVVQLTEHAKRLPEAPTTSMTLVGVSLPAISLMAHESSTPIKVEWALAQFGLKSEAA